MTTLFDAHGWKMMMNEAPLPDGRIKKQICVQRADTAHIIAVTDSHTILLLREFRPFYQQYIWQLPSGRIDKEADTEAGARRELREETGFDAKQFTYLFHGNHSETFLSTNHFFLAKDLVKSPLPQDVDELIEVHELPIAEALERVLQSPKVHLASAYGLMRYVHEQP